MRSWLANATGLLSSLPRPGRTRGQIVRAQTRSLRRLLAHAYENVPYYREAFDRAGIRPDDVRSLADLPALPVTTKDGLRGAPIEYVTARGYRPGDLHAVQTSGSVGEPFTVRLTGAEHTRLMFSWLRALLGYGRRPTDRFAILVYCRDDLIRRVQREESFRNASGILPKLTLNMCQPLESTLEDLRRYRPDFLGGYPGVLLRLAQMAEARHRRAIRPRVIWVGGEVVTDSMRREIRDAFGGRVYNCYASEEFKLIGWECPETGELHVMDDNVIVEVLKDGHPARPGERGEVVVTGLHSYAMPFIRYRLGDVATMGSSMCPCGLSHTTIREVHGRTIDYFTLPDGRFLHPYDIVRVMQCTADWVWRHHLVQERRDRIVLQVVPRGSPGIDAVRRLERAVEALLGPGIEFRVALSQELDPGPGRKLRYAQSFVKAT